jgi:replicative DNA helicase
MLLGRVPSTVADRVPDEALIDRGLRRLFKAAKAVTASGAPLSWVSIPTELKRLNWYSLEIDDLLQECVDCAKDRADEINEQATVLSQKHALRVFAERYKKVRTIEELQRLCEDTRRADTTTLEHKTLSDHIDDLLQRQQAIWDGEQPEGHRWGVVTLDRLLPIEPGKLYGLAGPKASGKTKLLVQVAILGLLSNQPVLFHSLEMPGRELLKRMLSYLAKIDSHLLLKRKTPRELWARIETEATKLRDAPLVIDPRPILTATQVADSIAHWKRAHDVPDGHGLVLVDFLQRVDHARRESDDNAGQRRTAYLMAAAAKDNNTAVVAALQTNKEFERSGQMAHTLVEGSGGYVQALDGCVMIDFPRLRKGGEPPKNGMENILLKVSKNREGQSGRTIRCVSDLRIGHFSEEDTRYNEPGELKLVN